MTSSYIHAPYMSIPPVAAQLPRHALDVGSAASEPYELAIQAVEPLPIITIDARAPTRAKAAKLASQGAEAVKAKADEPTVPGGKFVVEQISPIRTREIVQRAAQGDRRDRRLVVFDALVRRAHADLRAPRPPQDAPGLPADDAPAADQRLTTCRRLRHVQSDQRGGARRRAAFCCIRRARGWRRCARCGR